MKKVLPWLRRQWRFFSIVYAVAAWVYLFSYNAECTPDYICDDLRYVVYIPLIAFTGYSSGYYHRHSTKYAFHFVHSVNLLCYILAMGVNGQTFVGIMAILIACFTTATFTINTLNRIHRS